MEIEVTSFMAHCYFCQQHIITPLAPFNLFLFVLDASLRTSTAFAHYFSTHLSVATTILHIVYPSVSRRTHFVISRNCSIYTCLFYPFSREDMLPTKVKIFRLRVFEKGSQIFAQCYCQIKIVQR